MSQVTADDYGRKDEFKEPQRTPEDVGQKDGDIAPLEAKEQTTKQRDKLEDSEFAYTNDDGERKLPINDAAHVRNALARWNQTDFDNPADKKAALGKICSRAKKFGIESDLCKSKGDASAGDSRLHFGSHRFFYTAEPKFGGAEGDILMKAIVLEPGENVNGWEVDAPEFPRVADAYKAGRQLRLDHDKDHVSSVFGKSFNGQSMTGKDAQTYLGHEVPGIDLEGTYVVADFVATPMDPQVRTNIMKGYVETGSIGLDANAFCKACDKPLQITADGQVNRTCTDFTAGIVLKDVDVKEYSYVSEPAFPHAMLYPSFSAAVNSVLKRGSSLSQSESKREASMSTVTAAKKPEEEAATKPQVQMDADAYAEQRMNDYKKGLADAAKFRAAQPPEEQDGASANASDGEKVEAKASKDQVARTDKRGETTASAKDSLMARVRSPTMTAFESDPVLKEIFTAAITHHGAPAELRGKFLAKGEFRGNTTGGSA